MNTHSTLATPLAGRICQWDSCFFRFLLFAILTLGGLPVPGQSSLPAQFLKASGADIRNQAGQGDVVPLRGVNLQWLSLREMNFTTDKVLAARFGIAEKNQLMDTFLNSFINTNDLDAIAALGLNCVRVPFCFKTFLELNSTNLNLNDDSQYTTNLWRTNCFAQMDWLVQEAGKRGIYCILDFHDLQGFYPYCPDPAGFSALYQSNSCVIWQTVARHYATNAWVAGYDIINEPPGGPPTPFFNAAYKMIRAVDPDHIIFFETWSWDNFPNVYQSGYTNVAFSPHYYPYQQQRVCVNSDQEAEYMQALFSDSMVADRLQGTNSTRFVPTYFGEFFPNMLSVRCFEDNGAAWTQWMWKGTNAVTSDSVAIGLPKWLSGTNLTVVTNFLCGGMDYTATFQELTNAMLLTATPPVNINWYSTSFVQHVSVPIPQTNSFAVPTNGAISLEAPDLVANDKDMGTTASSLGIAQLSNPAHGVISNVGAEWIYTPNAGFSGMDTCTYRTYDTAKRMISVLTGTVNFTVGSGAEGSYWKFDEVTNNTTPDAFGTNWGTLNNGPTAATGKVNGGLNFTNGQNVSTSIAYNNPQVFTLAAWMKTTATNVNLINFGNATGTGTSTSYDRQLRLDASGHLQFYVWLGASKVITSSAIINDGNWHHVAASLSSTGMRLYVDGWPVAQNSTVTSAQSYTGYWNIGQMFATAPSPFSGSLDEVHVYQRRLGTGEIMALAQTSPQLPGAPTGLATLANSSTQITLSWTGPVTNVSSFAIERRSLSSTNFYLLGTTNGMAWADANLTANFTYYYRVRAVNPAGDAISAEQAGTTLDAPMDSYLDAPSNLIATVQPTPSVIVSFTNMAYNATAVLIERSMTGTNGVFTQVAAFTNNLGSGNNFMSWTDTNVVVGSNYFYRACASNNYMRTAYIMTTNGASIPGNTVWAGADLQNWNIASNWLGYVPTDYSACNITFNQAAARNSTNGLLGLTVDLLVITNGAGANTISGNPLILAGPVTNLATAAQEIGLNLSLSGNQAFNIASGGSLSLDGPIQDGLRLGAITKSGGGTLVLTGNNSFDGGLTFSGSGSGSVVVRNPNALGVSSNTVTFSGGGSGNLLIQLDTPINAYSFSSGSGNGGTITIDRASPGNGFQQALGSIWLSSVTFTLNSGTNIAGGNAGISFTDLRMGGGNDNSPVTLAGTADISVGDIYQTNNYLAKRLQLDGTSPNNVVWGSIYDGRAGYAVSLIKANTGTWTLNGTNTYSGTTKVSGGTLVVNGQIKNSSSVTVSSGATLGGVGMIAAPVTNSAGGTLSPGGTTIGTLTISNNLTLAGNVLIQVNKSSGQSNDYTFVSGLLMASGNGTLNVVNTGPALTAGDKFILFNQPVANGNLLTVIGGGVAWTNNLAGDGSISVGGIWTSNLTFDANVSTPNPQDGSGLWSTNTTNWWLGTSNVVWNISSNAVFGAGADGALDAYVITVPASTSAARLTFNNSGYVLRNSSPVNVTVANHSFTVASGKTNSIGTNINVIFPGGASDVIAQNGTLNIENGGKIIESGNSSLALDGTGVYNIYNGGGIYASNAYSHMHLAYYASSSVTVNVYAGGVLANYGTYWNLGSSGSGILNIEGGTVSSATNITLGAVSTAVGMINLNGGSLTLSGVTNGAGMGSFNFNGGTLKAYANNPNFIGRLTGAYVRNGGAIIDDGGFAITNSQALLHSTNVLDNATDGGLTKEGSGTLMLMGANTYTGPTIISAGTLALGGAGSLNSSPLISLANGAALDVSAISSYVLGNTATLASSGGSLIGSSGGTLSLGSQPLMLACDGSVPALTVMQASTLMLNANAITVSNATGITFGVGTNHLIQVSGGSISGPAPGLSGSIGGAGLAASTYATIQVNGNTVDLVVSALNAPILTGTPSNAVVTLSWDAVAGATSYNVKRGTSSGSFTWSTNVTGSPYVDSGLANGTTYYYVVSAVNGGSESANSDETNVTPIAPPSAPVITGATPSNGVVTLSWNGVAGAAS